MKSLQKFCTMSMLTYNIVSSCLCRVSPSLRTRLPFSEITTDWAIYYSDLKTPRGNRAIISSLRPKDFSNSSLCFKYDIFVRNYKSSSYVNSLHSSLVRKEPESTPFTLQNSETTAVIPKSNFLTEEVLDEEEARDLIWSSAPPFPNKTFNFTPFVNESYTLKKLIDLGVDLYQLEKNKKSTQFILKLDFDKDVAPYIRFLCDNEVPLEKVGSYFTRNPFILKENLSNLQKRLDFLRSKNFTEESITRIINANANWLSFELSEIDRRLGYFQKFFKLTGNEVRTLAATGPKLITSPLDKVLFVTFKLKEEMGFEPKEIVQLLLTHPRIWLEDPVSLWKRFDYLHNVIKISHEDLLLNSSLLLQREQRLKNRIEYLKQLGKNQFDPTKPNFISFGSICSGDDTVFATRVANTSSTEYNSFLKTL